MKTGANSSKLIMRRWLTKNGCNHDTETSQNINMRSITATKPTISPLKLEEKSQLVIDINYCQANNAAK